MQGYGPEPHQYGSMSQEERDEMEWKVHAGPLSDTLRADEENTPFVAYGKPPARRRLNSFAVLQAIFVPWAIFVGTFWVLSFSFHYYHPQTTYFIVACGLAFPLAFGARAYRMIQDTKRGEHHEPSWFVFLAVTCMLAWVAGLILGMSNFAANVDPYLDMSSLAIAKDVDPRQFGAARYTDSSRIEFREGARIAQNLALGFKNDDTYCVAPVVWSKNETTEPTPLASYDYWALGINCCVPMPPARFWCGDQVGSPTARGGLRLMGDSSYYRLAIQQAEAEYKIKATDPLFFTWTEDPVGHVEELYSHGARFFKTFVTVFLVCQCFLVLGMTVFYARVLTGGKAPML